MQGSTSPRTTYLPRQPKRQGMERQPLVLLLAVRTTWSSSLKDRHRLLLLELMQGSTSPRTTYLPRQPKRQGMERQPLVLRVAVRTTWASRFACCCEDNVGFSACRKPGGDPTTSHPHGRLRPFVLRVAVRTTWASRLAAWCENDVRFGAAYRRQRGYAKADGQAYRWQRGYAKAGRQPRKRLEPVTVKDDPTESRTHGA